MFHDNWSEGELIQVAAVGRVISSYLRATWQKLLEFNEKVMILPFARSNFLFVNGQFIQREVGTEAGNDPSWNIPVRAPSEEGFFMWCYDRWLSRPAIVATTEEDVPVLLVARNLDEAGLLKAWLGGLLQMTADRPTDMDDVAFEFHLSKKLLSMMEAIRDGSFATFSLETEIEALRQRFGILNEAINRPRPKFSLQSWETLKISIRAWCENCNQESEIFSATLDPMDQSSLGRAYAEVDQKIGAGITLQCSTCNGPCKMVRIYANRELQEEVTPEVFSLRYGPEGDKPLGNFG